jgi:WD40 repeat protein/energy-coupling factor transporter ATP-binding protein EcfA2
VANPYHVRLAISQYGDRFRAELFTEDLGDTDGELLPADWRESFERWMAWLQGGGSLPENTDVEIGGQLFGWVFGRVNRAKWAEILARLGKEPGRPLRLLIDSSTLSRPGAQDPEADRIHNLPYGLLYDPEGGYFLFRPAHGRPAVHYVRIIRRCAPRLLSLDPPRRPVRVLLAVAEPDGLEFDGTDQFHRLARALAQTGAFEALVCAPEGPRPLREALPGPPGGGAEAAGRLLRTTREQLRAALAAGPVDLVHLMAHGRGSGLLLCDPGGKEAEVRAQELGEWCRGRAQMAFLQVCRAARAAGMGSFGGLAQTLLNPNGGDLAAVVAPPYLLKAKQSTEAAVAFYEHLAAGEAPDQALRRDLEMTNTGWAFLELWVRPSALGDTGTRGDFQFVSPYRGLSIFREEDADLFFGRDAEVADLVQILGEEAVVAVVGDSGSGKSSLLQAGLAHHVRQHGLASQTNWRIVSVRPGNQPVQSLRVALSAGEGTVTAEVPVPEDWKGTLEVALEQACSPEQPLLLLFDQFEEIFTLCTDEAQRQAVAEMLAAMAGRTPRHFRLVLGLRSEYLGRVAALPGLVNLIKRPWVLKAPGTEATQAIVENPASHCGYTFQGPLNDGKEEHLQGLKDRVLSDVPGVATSLPLLEFALERLWLKAVARGSQEFTHADYDQLGGLAGAIGQYAEDVFLALSARFGPDSSAVAEALFKGVVSSQGTRRPRSRHDLEEEVEPTKQALARGILDHLVGERILTIRSSADKPGEALVDLAHEVLTSRWQRLKDWLAQDPEGRALKEAFQQDVEKWDRGILGTAPRSRKNLPTSDMATAYLAWIEKAKLQLTPVQQAFVEELRQLLVRRRLGIWSAVAAALLVAGIMTGLSLYAWKKKNDAENATGIANVEKDKAQRNLFAAQLMKVGEIWERDHKRGLELLEDIDCCPFYLRDFTWGYFYRRCKPEIASLHSLQAAGGPVFCPDGKTFASIDVNVIILSDISCGQTLRTLRADGTICSIAFSPDGTVVGAGISDGFVRLWDVATGKERATVAVGTLPIPTLAISPDGSRLATVSDNRLKLWDTSTGQEEPSSAKDLSFPTHLAFSPQGTILAIADSDKIHLWNNVTQRLLTMKGHSEVVTSMAFSTDGKFLASGSTVRALPSHKTNLKVWDVIAGKERFNLSGHIGGVYSLAFSSDSKMLASGGYDKTVKLWNLSTGQETSTLQGHADSIISVGFVFDGTKVASGTKSGTIKIWELERGQDVRLQGHKELVRSLQFSPPNGKLLASGSFDGTVTLWQAATGTKVDSLKVGDSLVASVAFSSDGKSLAAGIFPDGFIKLWNTETRNEERSLKAHQSGVTCVVFSPDGKTLASSSDDGTVKLWEVATWKERQLQLTSESVWCLAFSPDGKTLAAGDQTGSVKLWNLSAAKGPYCLNGHTRRVNCLAFFETTVASASDDGTVKLWDVSHRKEKETLKGHNKAVQAVAFSSDGKSLASGSADRTIKLWDHVTRRERATLRDHCDEVWAIGFSPDCKTLASSDKDIILRRAVMNRD